MTDAVSIALVGAGLVGKRHAEAIAASPDAVLHSVTDLAAPAHDFTASVGVPWYPSLTALFDAGRPDGVILATPNQLHVEQGLACVAAGVPALVEKPLAADVVAARELVAAGEAAGVALLVGHHRRHNPLVAAAKAQIDSGVLGTVVAVHGMFWLMKPDDYFDAEWRRAQGAGPVFVNLIHDVDLLRHLVGEVVSVQAVESNAIRGNAVEETSAVLLQFANGALGTINVSDTVVAPWSWELTAGENPAYPFTGQSCYFIGGTQGSMELPNLKVWTHSTERSWWEPISATHFPLPSGDPLVRQVTQFARVIRGEQAPLAPASEGLKTLEVIDAVKASAATGKPITLRP